MDKIDLRIKALELACQLNDLSNSELIMFIARDFYRFLDKENYNESKNIIKEEIKISLQKASCEQILDELQKRSIRK